MSEYQRLADLMALMREAMYGCTDGNCRINGRPAGMHTNGGCRCIGSMADIALELASEAERYRYRCGFKLPPASTADTTTDAEGMR
jgi:hypothetical protein